MGQRVGTCVGVEEAREKVNDKKLATELGGMALREACFSTVTVSDMGKYVDVHEFLYYLWTP